MDVRQNGDLRVDVVRAVQLQPHGDPGGPGDRARPPEGRGSRGHGGERFRGLLPHRGNGSTGVRRNRLGLYVSIVIALQRPRFSE